LLATFSDGFARCWKYNVDNLSFDSDPIVYNCKSLHRDAVRLAAVSKGGTRFATGGTDGVVRLFTSPSVTAEKVLILTFILVIITCLRIGWSRWLARSSFFYRPSGIYHKYRVF
jgi:WD40 repeat protein